jgi:hypothetical protein
LAAATIPEEDARAICALTKVASPAAWQDGGRPGALKCAFGVVCDPPHRGLQVEIYISKGHKVKRRTINFGLWDTSGGGWERVYQLTIADPTSPTHTERGDVWCGSHEHLGATASKLNTLDTATFAEALQRFCATVNLKLDDELVDPMDPATFSLKP